MRRSVASCAVFASTCDAGAPLLVGRWLPGSPGKGWHSSYGRRLAAAQAECYPFFCNSEAAAREWLARCHRHPGTTPPVPGA